ncbi:glycosyltransferase [Peribacillus frigoritolerans]|uniref:glycosyltransferase n=1 Tax=Peribacillus frigoritolerans TaxID=450367 RepID=UPI002E1A0AF2|nr:glycosyltransferase [Peribacillus frigoritolerans]
MLNRPYTFKGNEFIGIQYLFENIANNFTYECIVLPGKYKKDSSAAYIVTPSCSTEENTAGVGISINGNEIRVFEHSMNRLNTVILAHYDNSNWIELVLVYSNKIPSLFINGKLIAVGNRSPFNKVYPSGVLGGNEKGECYTGEIRSVKLWNKSLSVEHVALLKEKAYENNEHLTWAHDFLDGSQYKNGKKLNAKISVIMPTYNKFPDILMTLHSLECQNFDKNEFEVIIVDDGSGDKTPTIFKENPFSFHLKYIRSNHNIGRPNMRNLGIQSASGSIIIFLDAEILVNPDFILQHYSAHLKKEKIVVCGSMVLRGVFTKYHPEFNDDQLAQLNSMIRKQSTLSLKVRNNIHKRKPVNLLCEKDIYDQNFMKLSFEKPHVKFYKETLFCRYGNELDGFHFPWILFCTGNVSVKAKGIIEVGLFEEYPGYGWDDHEMGYRLYKRGYSFLNHTGLISYHQEHPIAQSNPQDALQNFVRVFKKYPEIQMRVFALHFLGISWNNINSVYESYLKLLSLFPLEYKVVKDAFYFMLESLASRLWDGKKLTNLLEGFPVGTEKVKFQLDELLKIPQLHTFVSSFKYMMNL